MDLFPNSEKREHERERKENISVMNQQQAMQSIEQIDDTIPISNQAEKEDLVRWQQDLDIELIKLTMKLRGLELIDGKWVTTRQPIINELGIQKVTDLAAPFLSKNMINSNFDERRVLNMLHATCDDMCTDLASNYKVYDLEEQDMDFVMREFKLIVIPGPFRALNDGERKHIRTFNKRVEGYMESGVRDNKKQGWLGI